jgi:hypothetical protein
LLTKAYFLTAIPALLVVWLVRRVGAVAIARAMAIAAVVGGWWYIRNMVTTGTLAGLSESVTLRKVGLMEMAGQALRINWAKAIDSILFSHLYFGAWSSLTVRSWMYHLFYMVVLIAAVGLLRQFRRPQVLSLLLVYGCFWAGQLYNVVLLYMSKGLGGSMGWYMYAVVGAEAVLCLAGLRCLSGRKWARWMAGVGAGLFALLDLYTTSGLELPYYAGLIRHRLSGGMESLHGSVLRNFGEGELVERLARLVPAGVLTTLWLLYLLGTVAAVASAMRPEVGCVPGDVTKKTDPR